MLFGRKNKQRKQNDDALGKLNGMEVKCIAFRSPDDYNENIIGRDGEINIHEDELIIICGNEIVFRHTLHGLEAGEFLSRDGVNLRYRDEAAGKMVTLVAYFKYHIK